LHASLVAPDSIRLSSDLVLLNRRLNETAEDADMIFILSSNRPEAIETAPAVPALSIRQSRCRCLMRFAEARWFAVWQRLAGGRSHVAKPCASPRGAAPPYNCGAISINVKPPARAARSIAYPSIVVRVLQRNDLAACSSSRR